MGVLGDSSVPAFQDKLQEQLQLRANLANTSVVIGPPSPGVAQEKIWIALLEVKGDEDWAALGRLQKEERYTQSVYISVITRDGESDSKRGRDTAYAIRKEIADQLLADPTVGATVWQAQVSKRQEFLPRLGIEVPDAQGHMTVDYSWREAALFVDIVVKNRM